MHDQSVAIIVLNWNRSAATVRCLESLLELDHPHIGIFVCDNASTDDSFAQLKAWGELEDGRAMRFSVRSPGAPGSKDRSFRTVALVQVGSNRGYASGNNAGLRLALDDGYDCFWILNNDTEVQPDALRHLLDRLSADPAIGICGSTIVYAHDPAIIQCRGGGSFDRAQVRGPLIGRGQPLAVGADEAEVERKLAYVSGASALVTREFLEQVGLMCEDYFLYWEEMDWAVRGAGKFKLGYAELSIVTHRSGLTDGRVNGVQRSARSEYHLQRSRLIFCRKHYRRLVPVVVGSIARRIARSLFAGDVERALVLLRALLGVSLPPNSLKAR